MKSELFIYEIRVFLKTNEIVGIDNSAYTVDRKDGNLSLFFAKSDGSLKVYIFFWHPTELFQPWVGP